MSKKFILVGGKKRAGKDTTSKIIKTYLQSKGISSEIMHFANPLKELLAKTLSKSIEELELLKEAGNEDIRKMLQNLGDGVRETFGDKIWVDILYKKAMESDKDIIIVSDWRYLSEILENSITIKVLNPSQSNVVDNHKSETELDSYTAMVTILNDGSSVDELKNNIYSLEIDKLLNKQKG